MKVLNKMKEMVGGCCVCSDERGWAENPLVYCDGHGCNVAVHQACYGIEKVPSGPWFCRKCESQERAARVKCELCPLKDGALKRTDSGGWSHVVCALFIPEAWFADVHTMEPIMLTNVPLDRFNRMCYICEENGKEVSKASAGACMQCNKNGCKENFHVTCAQAQGLLCEESGGYGDNVKYCGYCSYHYKKLKKDSNIKIIPAFKPIPADNATPDSTPEKGSNEPKVNISAEHKNRESLAARQLSGLTTTLSDGRSREHLGSVRSHNIRSCTVQSLSNNNKPDTDLKHADAKDEKPLLAPPSTSVTATTAPSPTSMESKRGSTRTPIDMKRMCNIKSETGRLFSTLPETHASVNPPVTTHIAFPTSLDGSTSGIASSHSCTPSPSDIEIMGRPRKTRAGSLDKDKKLRQGTKSGTVRQRNIKTSLSDDNDEHSLPNPKRTRIKSETISQPASTSTMPSASVATLGTQNLSVFGGEPHFPNPISRTPFLNSAAGLEKIEKLANGQSKPFLSGSFLGTDTTKSEIPGSMEELLERQWAQGLSFLMEQGQHFDIASLLKCLHQLKTENRQLEDYVGTLISRRDHLLAVNARLSLPFGTNQGCNPILEQSVNPSLLGHVTPNHLELSREEFSDDDDRSPINVVDTPDGVSSKHSPVTSGSQVSSCDLLRHQLFSPSLQTTTDQSGHSTSYSPVMDTTSDEKT